MLQEGLHSRSGLVRKGCALVLRGPKRLARQWARDDDFARMPPVLANSFPKSGTHLLDQIVAALPDRRNFGSFLASQTSSFQFRLRSESETCALVRELVPGELIRGHLWHSPGVATALRAMHAVHYLILRDPRDVVVSEAHYLRTGNRWHKLHPYFRDAESLGDAITLCIRGLDHVAPELGFYDVGRRVAQFEGWLGREDVCQLRFEELISEGRNEAIKRMIRFYEASAQGQIDVDRLCRRMEESILPDKSHTFRSGKSGDWRTVFSDSHRKLFKSVAGSALVRLGYENSDNW
ncbi:MAG: sulfotransferase domain-containing protein [Pirellulales bacterium]|nr:sulfotransferase domain-containing protein [Pirellulales bacterium]